MHAPLLRNILEETFDLTSLWVARHGNVIRSSPILPLLGYRKWHMMYLGFRVGPYVRNHFGSRPMVPHWTKCRVPASVTGFAMGKWHKRGKGSSIPKASKKHTRDPLTEAARKHKRDSKQPDNSTSTSDEATGTAEKTTGVKIEDSQIQPNFTEA